MSDLDALKTAVKESSELSNKGKHREALMLLDDAITEAKYQNQSRWVQILSQHAAVLADSTGDLSLVRHYCEEIVNTAPENAMARYAFADVLFRQGSTDLAKEQAIRSYSLVEHADTPEARGLLELIAKRWPDIEHARD